MDMSWEKKDSDEEQGDSDNENGTERVDSW